jgi:hypothetical protein
MLSLFSLIPYSALQCTKDSLVSLHTVHNMQAAWTRKKLERFNFYNQTNKNRKKLAADS